MQQLKPFDQGSYTPAMQAELTGRCFVHGCWSDLSWFWSQTGTQECAVLLVMQADVQRKDYLPTCDVALGSTLHAHFTTAAHDHVHGIAHSILPGDYVACFEVRLACAKLLNNVVML